VALADGYQIFLPQMPQHEYHFNNYWNGFVESFTFDPARPTSLLYRKTPRWLELTGACTQRLERPLSINSMSACL